VKLKKIVKEKCGKLMKMKSTIMMKITMIITMISIMMMATTMATDIMITITPMVTTIILTITNNRFIILTETINPRDTREGLVEADLKIMMFQDFKIIMLAIRSLKGLTTNIKRVQGIVIEIIIIRFLIIKAHSKKEMML